MVDNVAVTAGAGTTVATDDVGGVHYPRMKISDGVADSSIHLFVCSEDVASAGGETGILAMVKRSDTPAATSGTDGDFEYLQVSTGKLWTLSTRKFVTVTTTVTRPADTNVYATNDAWADSTSAPTSGGFTFTSAARASGGSGMIEDATIISSNTAGTQLQGEVVIFDTSVTAVNDNAAFAVSDSDALKLVGIISFTLADFGNNAVYHATGLKYGFTCSGSANLRYLIRVKNAYTPASAETLTVRLKISQID